MSDLYRLLLVPVDGSETSDAATRLAIRMAKPCGAELLFVHAINRAAIIAECTTAYGGDATIALQQIESYGAALLEEAGARAHTAGIASRRVVLDGRASPAIVEAAASAHADAIVMGTAGKKGLERLLIGSTAEGVIRAANVPTFVAHAPGRDGSEGPPFRSVFAAVDRSEPGQDAMRYAIALAGRFATRLIFCHIAEALDVPPGTNQRGSRLHALAQAVAEEIVEDACAAAAAAGVDAEAFVADGTPGDVIVGQAAACGSDVIVIGTHGRRGLDALWFGSVAQRVLRQSSIPVVTLRVAAPVTQRAAGV